MSDHLGDVSDILRRQQAEIAYWKEKATESEAHATWAQNEARQAVRREVEATKELAQGHWQMVDFQREIAGRLGRAEGRVAAYEGMLAGREEVLRALPPPPQRRHYGLRDLFKPDGGLLGRLERNVSEDR